MKTPTAAALAALLALSCGAAAQRQRYSMDPQWRSPWATLPGRSSRASTIMPGASWTCPTTGASRERPGRTRPAAGRWVDHDPYRAAARHAFNGRARAQRPGSLRLSASGDGLRGASIDIVVVRGSARPAIPAAK